MSMSIAMTIGEHGRGVESYVGLRRRLPFTGRAMTRFPRGCREGLYVAI